MNREQVLNTLRTHKPVLAERFGVTDLALFGSFARDQATDESDVDKWAKRVVTSRVKSVVYPGLHGGADVHALDWLADSLHLLVVLCLLAECGVQKKAEERIRLSYRFLSVEAGLVSVWVTSYVRVKWEATIRRLRVRGHSDERGNRMGTGYRPCKGEAAATVVEGLL